MVNMVGVTREKLISEFHLLEKKAEMLNIEPIDVFLIGGGNLALRGLKSSTKDVDIVVIDRRQFSLLQNLLEKPVRGHPIYLRQYKSEWEYDLGMTAKYVYPAERFNLDVFVKRVYKRLHLSESMVSRVEVPKEFASHEFFRIYLVSKEDIFLFKSVTSIERTRDVGDLVTLVETGLKYDLIIQEFENQLSMDDSLKILISEMIERVDTLMRQSGTVKGLNHFRKYLERTEG